MFYYVFGNNNFGGLFSFYLFISLFFGSSVWLPAACSWDWDWACPEGCWASVVYVLHLNEHLPETPSPAEQSRLFVFRVWSLFFWQCDTPTHFSLFLHISENILSGPQEHLAFSLVAYAASELFLIERWCLTVIYLVPPWFPVMKKKKDLTSQRLSSGLCPQGQHRNQIMTNNMTDTATSQALERVTGVLVSWAPPSGKGLSALVLASVSLQMGFKSNALSGLGLEINLSILCWKAWISLSPETLRICKGPIFQILSQQPGDGERGETPSLPRTLCTHSAPFRPGPPVVVVACCWSLHLDKQDKEEGKAGTRVLWGSLSWKNPEGEGRGLFSAQGLSMLLLSDAKGTDVIIKMEAACWTPCCRRGLY